METGLTAFENKLVRGGARLRMLSKGGLWEIKRHDRSRVTSALGSFAI